MKAIMSPYHNVKFNNCLVKYIQHALKLRSKVFLSDDEIKVYKLPISDKTYTIEDIINSIKLNKNIITYGNQSVINYIVYDLGQRFWYDEFKTISSLIPTLYLKYQSAGKL